MGRGFIVSDFPESKIIFPRNKNKKDKRQESQQQYCQFFMTLLGLSNDCAAPTLGFGQVCRPGRPCVDDFFKGLVPKMTILRHFAPGDGSCFFHSLAICLCESPEFHAGTVSEQHAPGHRLRQEVYSALEQNWVRFWASQLPGWAWEAAAGPKKSCDEIVDHLMLHDVPLYTIAATRLESRGEPGLSELESSLRAAVEKQGPMTAEELWTWYKESPSSPALWTLREYAPRLSDVHEMADKPIIMFALHVLKVNVYFYDRKRCQLYCGVTGAGDPSFPTVLILWANADGALHFEPLVREVLPRKASDPPPSSRSCFRHKTKTYQGNFAWDDPLIVAIRKRYVAGCAK